MWKVSIQEYFQYIWTIIWTELVYVHKNKTKLCPQVNLISHLASDSTHHWVNILLKPDGRGHSQQKNDRLT